MKKIFTFLAATMCLLSMHAATVTVSPNGDVCDVTVDDVTFNAVPVTTQGDINLVAINRDGVSLLVRYTTPAILVADGTVNGESLHYETEGYAAYALTFQIPNSDFETWNSNESITEPRHWHGFNSAKGQLASQAKSTLLQSEEVRPGTTGSKSAVIGSSSVFGVIANGTMTNGQLMAQSITPANTWNHSEMDVASTETDKWGDPFYTPLIACPDAIKTWLKFTQTTPNNDFPYATMSAVLFNGSKYQDPEPKKGDSSAILFGTKYTQADADSAAARVAAKASNTQIATCDWTEITLPFNYTDASKAKAILVTISTNATPGKGNANDFVYVDDMELVYNASISNIVATGVEGFSFDAATTDYVIEYTGDALTLTADNFDVTAEGQSALVVKTVENLGRGNYRVAIGATGPDFKNQVLYTITINKRPVVYILGEVNDNEWAANNGLQMDTEDGIVHTATVTTNRAEGSYFSFTTELANDNDEGGWAYIKPFRFGAELNGDGDFWITDELVNTVLNLGPDGTERAYRLEPGKWNFSLDLSARTLVVTAVSESIVGDVNLDGLVNVQDVNIMININLGKNITLEQYPNADIDGNGQVDVIDINRVISIVLSKQ